MMDDLQQAYAAYQSALVNLPNPKVGQAPALLRRCITDHMLHV